MNSFLYKSDSKELWLNRRMPGINDPYYKDKMKVFNSRLHYTCSPELAAILTEGQEVKENEFQVVDDKNNIIDRDPMTDYPVYGDIAIPLPEHKSHIKPDERQMGSWGEWHIAPEHTNQEAGKQSAEWYESNFDFRQMHTATEMEQAFIAGAKWQSTQPAAATPVKGDAEEFFESRKITLRGINGGDYIDKDDFLAYTSQFEAAPKGDDGYVITGGHFVKAKGDDGLEYSMHNAIEEYENLKAAPKGDDFMKAEYFLHKHTGGYDYTIPTLLKAMEEYASQFAAPQAVKWVQASERLPDKIGFYFIEMTDLNNLEYGLIKDVCEYFPGETWPVPHNCIVKKWLDEGSTDT